MSLIRKRRSTERNISPRLAGQVDIFDMHDFEGSKHVFFTRERMRFEYLREQSSFR